MVLSQASGFRLLGAPATKGAVYPRARDTLAKPPAGCPRLCPQPEHSREICAPVWLQASAHLGTVRDCLGRAAIGGSDGGPGRAAAGGIGAAVAGGWNAAGIGASGAQLRQAAFGGGCSQPAVLRQG